jgi:hypothetical protein
MIKDGDMDATNSFISRMGNEIKNLVKSAIEISYYSRGAWSYNQVLMMTQAEREMVVDFINKRLEIASKSMYPVF